MRNVYELCPITECDIFPCKLELGYGEKIGIYKDGFPYLLIEIELANLGLPFHDRIIWQNQLYIGEGKEVVIIDLQTHSCDTLKVDGYFGSFWESKEFLLVASMTSVYCLEPGGQIKWITEPIAIDGIIFEAQTEQCIQVSCCMDPCPAQWCDRSIFLVNGVMSMELRMRLFVEGEDELSAREMVDGILCEMQSDILSKKLHKVDKYWKEEGVYVLEMELIIAEKAFERFKNLISDDWLSVGESGQEYLASETNPDASFMREKFVMVNLWTD